jgi:hypothetical protein
VDSAKIINAILIVAVCTAAATLYGILHDQVTVRVCLEYFTVFHPPIFRNQSPTMLALLWGANATWWIGYFLGCLLALAACPGRAPMTPAKDLVKPVLKLLLAMALSALVAGVVGYGLVESGTTTLPEKYGHLLRTSMHSRLMADAFAHNASYLVGLFGGCLIVFKVWKTRRLVGASLQPSES